MKTKLTPLGNPYVETDGFDPSIGREPLPKVWDLQLHGRPVARLLRHKDAERLMDSLPGRGWAIASVHPDSKFMPRDNIFVCADGTRLPVPGLDKNFEALPALPEGSLSYV